jgi:hypothetical protein
VKRKRPALTFPQLELAISFYDMAADYPKESFEQITKRVLPLALGKSKTSAAFRKEARKMFDLAR